MHNLGVFLESGLLSKEQVAAMALQMQFLVVPFFRLKGTAPMSSCLSHLPIEPLQPGVHGAALEDPLEAAAGPQCSGSSECITVHLCNTTGRELHGLPVSFQVQFKSMNRLEFGHHL